MNNDPKPLAAPLPEPTMKPICVMQVKGWDAGTPGVSIACPIHIPGHIIGSEQPESRVAEQ